MEKGVSLRGSLLYSSQLRDAELMDCRSFRQQHLSYLDDTLCGDVMGEAQCHLLECDSCAAHDMMVRRSLMLVRNIPEIEPSSDFGARLQARLESCENEPADNDYLDRFLTLGDVGRGGGSWRASRIWFTMAAGVTVVGTMALAGAVRRDAAEPALAPVLASAPAVATPRPPIISAELLQAMSTGNPMWSMALLVEDAPVQFLSAVNDAAFSSLTR